MKYIIQKNIKRTKTISITVDKTGLVIIKAPLKTSDDECLCFMEKSKDWIDKKLAQIETNSMDKRYFYLGKEYSLKTINAIKNRVSLDENEIIIFSNNKKPTEQILQEWYKEEAKKIFTHITNIYAQKTSFIPAKITIKNQKTRLGSCSHTNNINLNYKLIHTPIYIIEYVILHELCHIKEKNHSKKYWDLVEQFMPDYKTCEKWLKTNHFMLE